MYQIPQIAKVTTASDYWSCGPTAPPQCSLHIHLDGIKITIIPHYQGHLGRPSRSVNSLFQVPQKG